MIDSMYTDIILHHNKSKKNKGEIKEPTFVHRGHNPSCGDDLTLLMKVEDGIIVDAKYIGKGCAISQASMSIMIDLVKNKPFEEAKKLADSFTKMIRGEELTEEEEDALEDAVIFENLSNMPARVKCGTLSWHCVDALYEEYNKKE